MNNNNHALLIGIGKRPSGDHEALNATLTNVKSLACVLGNCGYLNKNIVSVLGEEATTGNILEQLDELIAQTNQQEADLVLVYFSGHGTVLKNDQGEFYYLISYNTQKNNIQTEAIKGQLFVEKLNLIKTDKLLVVLDCCHAGGMTLPPNWSESMLPIPKESLISSKNRAVISASHETEKALLGAPHSLFTHILLEGLRGQYFKNSEINVSLFDLAMYTREQVFTRSKGNQKPQLDVLEESATTNFIIASYPSGKPNSDKNSCYSRVFSLYRGDAKLSLDESVEEDLVYRKQFEWLKNNTIDNRGDNNIILQDITANSIVINYNNGQSERLEKTLEALLAFLTQQQIQTFKFGGKHFNRENLNEKTYKEFQEASGEAHKEYIYNSFETSITEDEFADDIKRLSTNFEGRETDQELILDFIDREEGLLYVTGNAGIGKSSLAAKAYQKISEDNRRKHLIPYFIKRNTPSSRSINLFAFFNRELEHIVQSGEPIKNETNQLIASFRTRLKSIKQSTEKVVFLIDGLDELESSEVLKNLSTEIHPNVIFIFFTRYTNEVEDVYFTAKSKGAIRHKLKGLDIDTLRKIVSNLGEEFNLSVTIQKQIIKNSQGNPKYLELLRLSIKNGSIVIDNDHAFIPLMPSDASGNSTNLFNDFYEPLLKKYAQNKDVGEDIENIIRTLTVARDYLTVFQISRIMGLQNFTRIDRTLPFIKEILLVKKYGERRYDYHFQLLHESLREYINERYKSFLVDNKDAIFSFCKDWKKLLKLEPIEVKYPLNYYATHIKERIDFYENEEDKVKLFELAKDDKFIEAQLDFLEEYQPSFELMQYAVDVEYEDKKYVNVAHLGQCTLKLHYGLLSQFNSSLDGIKNKDLERLKKTISKIKSGNEADRALLLTLLLFYTLVGEGKENPSKKEILEFIIDDIELVFKGLEINTLSQVPLPLIFELLQEAEDLNIDISPFYGKIGEAIAGVEGTFIGIKSNDYLHFINNLDLNSKSKISILFTIINEYTNDTIVKKTVRTIYGRAIEQNSEVIIHLVKSLQSVNELINFDSYPKKDQNIAKIILAIHELRVETVPDFSGICQILNKYLDAGDKASANKIISECLKTIEGTPKYLDTKLQALDDVMSIVLSIPGNERLIEQYLGLAKECLDYIEERGRYRSPSLCETLLKGIVIYPSLRSEVLSLIEWEKGDTSLFVGGGSYKYKEHLFEFARQVFYGGRTNPESFETVCDIFRGSRGDDRSLYEKIFPYLSRQITVDYCLEVVESLQELERSEEEKEYKSSSYLISKMRLISHLSVSYYAIGEDERADDSQEVLFATFEKFTEYFGGRKKALSHLGYGYYAFIGLFHWFDFKDDISEATKIGDFINTLFDEARQGNIESGHLENCWTEFLFSSKNKKNYTELLSKEVSNLFLTDESQIYAQKYMLPLLREGDVIGDELILQKEQHKHLEHEKKTFQEYAKLFFSEGDYEQGYAYLEKDLRMKHSKGKIEIGSIGQLPNILLNRHIESENSKTAQEFYSKHKTIIDDNSYYEKLAFFNVNRQNYEKAIAYAEKCDYNTKEGLFYELARLLLEKGEEEESSRFACHHTPGNDVRENMRVLPYDEDRIKESSYYHLYSIPPNIDYYFASITDLVNEQNLSGAFRRFNQLSDFKPEHADKICELIYRTAIRTQAYHSYGLSPLAIWIDLCKWGILATQPIAWFSQLIKHLLHDKEELGTVCKVLADYSLLEKVSGLEEYHRPINQICEDGEGKNLIINSEPNSEKILPKELTDYVPIPKVDKIVGRHEELNKIRGYLLGGSNSVWVTGPKGIGKTALVEAYRSQYYNSYNHIIWLELNSGEAEAGIVKDSKLLNLLNINAVVFQIEKSFDEFFQRLEEFQTGPVLLIFDGAEAKISDMINYFPSSSKWHIIATTKEHVEGVDELPINTLPEEDALTLFNRHCTRINDEERIKKILKLVDYHSLTIELLAKAAERQKLDVDKLEQEIMEDYKRLDDLNSDQVEPLIQKGFHYPNNIWGINSLDEVIALPLKQFSALPLGYYEVDFLENLLKFGHYYIDNEVATLLDKLWAEGWVQKKEGKYKINLIVAEAIWEQDPPTTEDLIGVIGDIERKLNSNQHKDNSSETIFWISMGQTLANNFEKNQNYHIASLNSGLGYALWSQKDFDDAKTYFDRALSIYKSIPNNEEKVVETYTQMGYLFHTMGNDEEAITYLKKASKFCESAFGKQSHNTATSYINIKNMLRATGDLIGTKKYLEEAIKVFEVISPLTSQDADLYEELGGILENFREFEEAIGGYNKSLKIRMQPRRPHIPTDFARIYSKLGSVYESMGDFAIAKENLEKSLEIYKESYGDYFDFDTAIIHNSLASLLKRMGKLEEARVNYEEALNLCALAKGENDINTAILCDNLSFLHWDLGDLEQSVKLFTRTLNIRINILGEDHLDTASSYVNLGFVLRDLEEWEKAEEILGKALKIRKAALGEHHKDTITCYENLGYIFYQTEYLDDAKEMYEIALTNSKAILGEQAFELVRFYDTLGYLNKITSCNERAKEMYEMALTINLTKFGEQHSTIARIYSNLAEVLQSMKIYEESKQFYLKALEINKAILEEGHLDIAYSHKRLGYLLRRMGELIEAKENMEKALEIFTQSLPKEHRDITSIKKGLNILEKEIQNKN